jgi:DeoR/GlpR family transcriptional regulator of sugar metabolism
MSNHSVSAQSRMMIANTPSVQNVADYSKWGEVSNIGVTPYKFNQKFISDNGMKSILYEDLRSHRVDFVNTNIPK